ncbi:hypothetical protein ACFJIX_08920 [Roseateles sp. UC29_93]|uniref:hypothetical protein n=1 Tax=Roseateles sp. UC29_93 TaxID=3350177 RepID=UPI00366C0912
MKVEERNLIESANASSSTKVLGNDKKPQKSAAAQLSAFDASIERGLAEINAGGGIPAELAFKRLFEKYPHLR